VPTPTTFSSIEGFLLPAFVNQLLEHRQGPREIPEIPIGSATGWLGPLASATVRVLDTGSYRAPGAFFAHGYAHLPLPAPGGHFVHLRLWDHTGMAAWPVSVTSVVLTVTGTLELEMYRDAAAARATRPQYARSFGAEQVFTVHEGTLCTTEASPDALQVLITQALEADGVPLTGGQYRAAARSAWSMLEGAARGGDRS
jgi:hypothetical protein